MKIQLPTDRKSSVDLEKLASMIKTLADEKNVSDFRWLNEQLRILMPVLVEQIAGCEREKSNAAFQKILEFTPEEEKKRDELKNCWKGIDQCDGFYYDGFYPAYYDQPIRILFVGREAWGEELKNDGDYISYVGHRLVNEQQDGGWVINQYPFHRRQFYMAYGILAAFKGIMESGDWKGATDWINAFPTWDDVPFASELSKIFARTKGDKTKGACVGGLDNISWAIMNLSKICNCTGRWQTDYSVYSQFIEVHKEEIKKEIEILDPHIIIGANVYDLVKLLGYEGTEDSDDPNCFYYYDTTQKLFPPLLNCYHFAAIKNEKTCFYDSVMKVLWKHKDEWIQKALTEWSENRQVGSN